MVQRLRAEHGSEVVNHRKVHRPWGCYDAIDHGDRFQVKRIIVEPGASLSLQMHYHRAEHWVVVRGTARVTCGETVSILSENQSTYIPIGTLHRLENPGKTPLEIIEVQSGSYLGEDDIVRLRGQLWPQARRRAGDDRVGDCRCAPDLLLVAGSALLVHQLMLPPALPGHGLPLVWTDTQTMLVWVQRPARGGAVRRLRRLRPVARPPAEPAYPPGGGGLRRGGAGRPGAAAHPAPGERARPPGSSPSPPPRRACCCWRGRCRPRARAAGPGGHAHAHGGLASTSAPRAQQAGAAAGPARRAQVSARRASTTRATTRPSGCTTCWFAANFRDFAGMTARAPSTRSGWRCCWRRTVRA